MIIYQVIACVLVADFFTGFFHWIEDTYGLPSWPIIGEAVIQPNIMHHRSPLLFTMSSFICRNYQVVGMATFFVLIVSLLGYLTWHVFLVALLTSCGNEVHSWSHKRPRFWLARFLQDCSLIQTPQQHAKHHKKPYDKYFCTLTNVLNPCLELVRFWRGLELALRCVGVKPMRVTEERGFF